MALPEGGTTAPPVRFMPVGGDADEPEGPGEDDDLEPAEDVPAKREKKATAYTLVTHPGAATINGKRRATDGAASARERRSHGAKRKAAIARARGASSGSGDTKIALCTRLIACSQSVRASSEMVAALPARKGPGPGPDTARSPRYLDQPHPRSWYAI